MKRTQFAFTLVELLVVLAIMAVVAGITYPVFASVRGQSHKAVCLSNFRQISSAAMLYSGDYDDRFVLVNHQPAEEPNSRNDRTWVQLILPYIRDFSVFQCPSDTSVRPRPETTFDEDLVPGDIYSQFYSASLRTNAGYNFQYLAPILKMGNRWTANPKSYSGVNDPSKTLVFVDSVWSVNSSGQPEGGGSWLVVPPCRYEKVGMKVLDSFLGTDAGAGGSPLVFTTSNGWELDTSLKGMKYGGVWPWHQAKRLNVMRADGSVRSNPLSTLTEGCQFLDNWRGYIYDKSLYVWDSQ